MAPQDWDKSAHARYLERMCPRKFNSARDAYARLHEIEMLLANQGADLVMRCDKGNGQECELPRHLSVWNDMLGAIQVRLKERATTGELEVSFPAKSFDHRETNWRVQRAMILLHWLFVKHACVAEIEMGNLGQFDDAEWFALLCDGISKCPRLKTLEMNAYVGADICVQQLLKACALLQHLEEITFESYCEREQGENMVALEAVIKSNTQLRRFQVGEFIAVPQDLSPILQALAVSLNISHLSLNVSYVKAEDASLFLQMLNGNNVLKSLRLVGSASDGHLTVNSVASALANATALAELELVGFPIHTIDAWVLASSLVRRQTLQHLDLLRCIPVFTSSPTPSCAEANGSRGLISSHAEPYVHILQKLLSLRKLSLDMLMLRFTPEDQRVFFEALNANDFLHDVCVTAQHLGYPSELARIAHEAGTASRIRTSLLLTDEGGFVDLPSGSRLHVVRLEAMARTRINEVPTVSRWFADLIKFDHVAKLTVAITGGIQVGPAKLLGLYLETTKYLKQVTLIFSAGKESSMLLVDGLALNTSITSLSVEHWCLSRRSAVLLADVVCSSRMIHTLNYNRYCAVPTKAFFSRLCKSIGSSFTIVSLNSSELWVNAKYCAIIQETTTRNAIFLERAARLVAGLSYGKIDAEAFEVVASSPLLVPRVQKMMSVCEQEAATMIRSTLIGVKELDMFMSLAGVVREGVVCEESGNGRPRLDTLPLECWLAIRRYLSFADVA